MAAPAENDADAAAYPGLRTGRWRLPAGQVRRAVHDALRTWGLGPAAGDLSDQLTALVQDLLTRAAARGPVDLRLELRASARLLLGEIRDAAPAPSGAAGRPSDHADGHGIIALTYGRRPSRKRVRYIHSFAWWQQDAIADQ
ncbi:hypothetical protein [Actinomadura formosensis]|uniref:hypothetical protein n=1 Tax=Actinomadura formosensis TaxID=60706 RepID=UPI00083208F5|nr:hypothetical protein [Actinomadura formosensis]